MEGGRRGSRVELAKTNFVLNLLYFTLLPFSLLQSKRTIRVRSRILYDIVLVANLVAFVCLTAAVTLSTNLQSANTILGWVGSAATFLGFIVMIDNYGFPRRPALLLIFLLSRTYQASG